MWIIWANYELIELFQESNLDIITQLRTTFTENAIPGNSYIYTYMHTYIHTYIK